MNCAAYDGLQHKPLNFYRSNHLHMQEKQVISMLTGRDVDRRLSAIGMLEEAVDTRSGHHLPFTDCQNIFLALSTVLEDAEHDARLPCLRMMLGLVPCLASDAGVWTATVLPSVIRCFDDARSAVHLCIVQILSSSLKNLNFQTTMQAIICQGVENDDMDIRKLVMSYLPMLFTDELQNKNFVDLVYSLFSSLSEKYLQSDVIRAIRELSNLVGKEKFAGYMDAMPTRLKDTYLLLVGEENLNENNDDNAFSRLEHKKLNGHEHQESFSNKDAFTESFPNVAEIITPHSQTQTPNSLQFGFILAQNLDSIMDDSDPRSRGQAVGDLRTAVADCNDIDRLVPNLQKFIEFLIMLLDDSNTQVNKLTLEIFGLLVDKLNSLTLKPYVRHMVLGLTKHLGDNIPFIREGIMKIVMHVIQIYTPNSCLSVVCENLSHRNSRVRHESINVIIIALLTFPSSDFDLNFLCQKVAYALIDPKRQVRQAALECLAVLGQALGPPQCGVLLDAVRTVANSTDSLGALAAVQARLMNRQLPKKDACGLVEYVTCAFHTAGNGNTADVDWILAASSGHGSSARSAISDSVSLESVETSAKHSNSSSARLRKSPSQSRSRLSIRRSLAKMPWDAETNLELQAKHTMKRNASSGDVTKAKAFQDKWHLPNDVPLARGDWQTDVCPLPTYPRLVRSGSVKRISSCSAIPPIQGQIDQPENRSAAMSKSCWFPLTAGGSEESSETEFQFASTKRPGNSAGKRRVDKIFEKLEKREEQKSSRHQETNVTELDVNELSDGGESSQIIVPAITGDKWLKRTEALDAETTLTSKGISSHSSGKQSSELVEYNPLRGVTFRNNPTSDVAVVGKKYAEDSRVTDLQPTQPIRKTCDRRRLSKGMFDKGSSTLSPSVSDGSGDDRPLNPALKNNSSTLLNGVYGFSVLGLMPNKCKEEEQLGKRIGANAQSVKSKQPSVRGVNNTRGTEMNSDGDERRPLHQSSECEEQKNQQLVEGVRTEKQRRLDSRLNYGNLPEENFCVAQKPPLVPDRKDHLKKEVRKSSADAAAAAARPSSHSSADVEEDPADLLPSSKPLSLLSVAVKQLAQDDDWEVKCKGLNNIRRLAMHHPKVFSGQVVSLAAAVTVEVKSLRSCVSVLAMKCLADMYAYLKSEMDIVLHQTVVALLLRFGDANNFIREEAENSLRVVVENVTAQKAICCLISGGSQQRNSSIRALTAQLILSVVESLGPGRVLSGVKDITDKILPAAAAFLSDGSPETRFCARKMFHILMAHEDFDKILPKYLSRDALNNIQDKLDHLKAKGLGDPEVNSARNRRTGNAERKPSSRHHSASRRPSSDSSVRVKRFDERAQSEISEMIKKLTMSDFRERCKGIEQLRDMTASNLPLFTMNITLVFDSFVPCLRDANSKVTLLALQVFQEIIPIIHPYMGNVVSLSVEPVVAKLASNNKETRVAAARVLDLFVEFLDSAILLPSFTSQAQNCGSACKPVMIQRIAYLVPKLYQSKRKCVTLHVLPLAWHLLSIISGNGGASSNLRSSAAILVKALYAEMKENLFQAASNSNISQHVQDLLREMIKMP